MSSSGSPAPSERTRLGRRIPAISIGLIAMVIAFRHASVLQFFCDDCFMSFRIAANFVAGDGLVYNPGERVEGFTNFLWIVLLSVGMLAGASPETTSLVLGALSLLFLAGLVFALVWRLTACWIAAAVATLLLAASGPLIQWSLSGMESGFFTAMVLLAITLYHGRHARIRALIAAGGCYAVATMVRPDGVIFGAIAGLHLVGSSVLRRHSPSSSVQQCSALAAGFFIPMLPFILGRYWYYGDWLPNTYHAKTGSSVQWFLGVEYWRAFGRDYPLLWWGTWVGIAMALRASLRPSHRDVLLHLGMAVLGFGLYVIQVGGDYMALYRFSVPILPMIVILTTAGIHGLVTSPRVGGPTLRPIAIGVATLALVSGVWSLFLPTHASLAGDSPGRMNSQRVMKANTQRWLALGEDLRRRLWPNARIATTAAGALAYRVGAYTLDQSGLCDRYTAQVRSDPWRLGVPGHMKMATRAHLLNQQPPIDLILSHPLMGSSMPTVPLSPPSADYALYRFAADGLNDEEGKPLFVYGFLHRSRWGQAPRHGLFEVEL